MLVVTQMSKFLVLLTATLCCHEADLYLYLVNRTIFVSELGALINRMTLLFMNTWIPSLGELS